jgi:hypothetical protein
LKCQNHQAKDKKYPLVQQQQQQQQQQKEEEKEAFVFFISGLNEKKERILIHEAIRKFGRGIIVADTITSPEGSKVIRVRHATIQT